VELSYVAVDLLPVDRVPVYDHIFAGRTSQCCHRRHLPSPLQRFSYGRAASALYRDERPGSEVSLLSPGVMLPFGFAHSRSRTAQPLSSPLQEGICFFQHPLPAGPSTSLAARLPPSTALEVVVNGERLRAYHIPCKYPCCVV
jgi:hypothetical protein